MRKKVFFPVMLVVLSVLFSSCNNNNYEKDLPAILGVKDVEFGEKTNFKEFCCFNGDGTVFESYELSEKTILDFENKIKSSNRISYLGQNLEWELTPMDSSSNSRISMVIDYMSSNSKMDVRIKDVERLIKKDGVYYCILFHGEKDNVKFFVLDSDSKTLYAIDQQI